METSDLGPENSREAEDEPLDPRIEVSLDFFLFTFSFFFYCTGKKCE